jgi:DNA repair photolyase
MRTRGSGGNPPNRFEPIRSVPKPEESAELEGHHPETRLLADPSRTIVATNTSRDVGFDASVNPYRGCEHGCAYCLAPDTPVLHADLVWRPIGEVAVGDVLVGFDEEPAPGRTRKLRPAVVEAVWWSRRPTLRLVTSQTEVVTTAEHRWLQARDFRWSRTEQLAEQRSQLCYAAVTPIEPAAAGYRAGYVAGLPLGDETICRPPIARKRDAIFGRMPDTLPERVERIERGGARDVVDIQTSTRTFYAGGLATHNCYARPTHEYLGFSAGLDFETRILVKERAPELLRARLSARSWRPRVVALSGVTDAYQPAERRLGITRRCLEVLAKFRNPVAVVTKSFLVTRDADLLAELASFGAASVSISITTLAPELQRRMEPRAAPPARRLAAIEVLARAGVPVGVMVAPIVPGLTDHEAPAILAAAAAAGAGFAGRVVLRLPHGVAQLFDAWLAEHYPERRARVLSRVRAIRGGRLYDSRFGVRQRGEGFFADEMDALFELARRRAGLAARGPELSTASFRRPGSGGQLALL